MFKKPLLLIVVLSIVSTVFSQNRNTKKIDSTLIQFSGLLLTSDSIHPIPFASVYVNKNPYGYYSNLDGYFSIVASKGDTVIFSHVEFNRTYFIIPDTLKEQKYSIIKLMTKDTQYFPGVMITAMPPRATFDYLFVTKEIPNDDISRAKDNLEREAMRDQASTLSGSDASEAYKAMAREYSTKYNYAAGQVPPMNLLNPFAWAQFFESWKRGDYKKKKPATTPKPSTSSGTGTGK